MGLWLLWWLFYRWILIAYGPFEWIMSITYGFICTTIVIIGNQAMMGTWPSSQVMSKRSQCLGSPGPPAAGGGRNLATWSGRFQTLLPHGPNDGFRQPRKVSTPWIDPRLNQISAWCFFICNTSSETSSIIFAWGGAPEFRETYVRVGGFSRQPWYICGSVTHPFFLASRLGSNNAEQLGHSPTFMHPHSHVDAENGWWSNRMKLHYIISTPQFSWSKPFQNPSSSPWNPPFFHMFPHFSWFVAALPARRHPTAPSNLALPLMRRTSAVASWRRGH